MFLRTLRVGFEGPEHVHSTARSRPTCLPADREREVFCEARNKIAAILERITHETRSSSFFVHLPPPCAILSLL
jgi:hypothetical protein